MPAPHGVVACDAARAREGAMCAAVRDARPRGRAAHQMAHGLLCLQAMKRSADYADDMMTLARLHAALDSVVDTEQVMTQIHETSTVPQPTVARVRELVAEARELLRSLLVRPEARHPAVGKSPNHQDAAVR